MPLKSVLLYNYKLSKKVEKKKLSEGKWQDIIFMYGLRKWSDHIVAVERAFLSIPTFFNLSLICF